jgi:Cu+-exporting ATPase
MHAHVHDRPPIRENRAAVSEFAVTGMNCQNCARHVTEAIQGLAGVAGVDVKLDQGRAAVSWRGDADPRPDIVIQAVAKAGYGASLLTEDAGRSGDSPPASPMAAWRFTLIFGAVLTAPLMIGDWLLGLGTREWFGWMGLSLSAPVMMVCGGRFFRGAWQQLKRGASNMDTLVALGSSTAFGYSTAALLLGWHGHTYFMEAAAIITLISAGHYIEALVSARAAGSLRALMDLAPQEARKLAADGSETEVSVAGLVVDDRVVLKPGDRAPTDGEVVDGDSAMDESMLTGESLPVEKKPGSRVYAGTVNQNGRIVARVTATGEGTALARIIAVVQRAQNSRANIQRLADRISSVFVPVVVLIALGTGLWWGFAYGSALQIGQHLAPYLWPVHFPSTSLASAFIHAAAVLIVACPCAMGLATPVVIMAGTNVAARRGILIRDGIALEKSGTITAVVFDKTGTLTHGKPSVGAVEDLREPSGRTASVEAIAAALADPSNHPLSRAVAALGGPLTGSGADAASRKADVRNWRELRGKGVEGSLDGKIMRLGSLTWLAEMGVDVGPAETFLEAWTGRGATVLGLASDDRLAGLLALSDSMKPHAAEVLSRLALQGMHLFLLTGDNRLTAAALAKQAGIPGGNVFAEIPPEQKADIVRQLQQRGERVAFVGDGINDAPALEQADLGIAVAKASDVAREAADIILLNSDIQAIPEALGLARAALRTIRQNLFWAFFYNAAAVPLAALGFLSPILCAAAMGFSDLIVIGNALRLRRWKGTGIPSGAVRGQPGG